MEICFVVFLCVETYNNNRNSSPYIIVILVLSWLQYCRFFIWNLCNCLWRWDDFFGPQQSVLCYWVTLDVCSYFVKLFWSKKCTIRSELALLCFMIVSPLTGWIFFRVISCIGGVQQNVLVCPCLLTLNQEVRTAMRRRILNILSWM